MSSPDGETGFMSPGDTVSPSWKLLQNLVTEQSPGKRGRCLKSEYGRADWAISV